MVVDSAICISGTPDGERRDEPARSPSLHPEWAGVMPPQALRRTDMTTTTLQIEGMTCSACIQHVSNALALDGVSRVNVRLAESSAVVEHESSIASSALIAALRGAGYEASIQLDAHRAPKAAGCCCGPRSSR